MSDLVHKKCVPCEGGIDPLSHDKVQEYLSVVPGWVLHEVAPTLVKGRESHLQIEREFTFKDFKEAIRFINSVAGIAEEEGHHPNIYLYGWNKVRLELYTHAIGGLHENDFVIAAKVNAI